MQVVRLGSEAVQAHKLRPSDTGKNAQVRFIVGNPLGSTYFPRRGNGTSVLNPGTLVPGPKWGELNPSGKSRLSHPRETIRRCRRFGPRSQVKSNVQPNARRDTRQRLHSPL